LEHNSLEEKLNEMIKQKSRQINQGLINYDPTLASSFISCIKRIAMLLAVVSKLLSA
jgi:hypothetical protein